MHDRHNLIHRARDLMECPARERVEPLCHKRPIRAGASEQATLRQMRGVLRGTVDDCSKYAESMNLEDTNIGY